MEWLILLAVLAVCGVGEQLQRIANAIQTKHQPQEPQEDPYGPLLHYRTGALASEPTPTAMRLGDSASSLSIMYILAITYSRRIYRWQADHHAQKK